MHVQYVQSKLEALNSWSLRLLVKDKSDKVFLHDGMMSCKVVAAVVLLLDLVVGGGSGGAVLLVVVVLPEAVVIPWR